MNAPQGRRDMCLSDLPGKAVAVIGMGRSGISAARLLESVGARVTLADERPASALRDERAQLSGSAISFSLGRDWGPVLRQVELVVVSPGVPAEHPSFAEARERGIPIVGEIELASWFLDVPLIAVTGTNGKSTTVRLIGALLKEAGQSVFVGGNLGTPLCEAVNGGQSSTYDLVVAEVSSFQLETVDRFRPWVAAFLNCTPDHLDRHPTLDRYCELKRTIFRNQREQDIAILNFDDPLVAASAEPLRSERVWFSLDHPLSKGVYLEGEAVMSTVAGPPVVIATRDQIPLPGRHNLANVLAALAVAMVCGCSPETIRRTLRAFPGIEHALEFVRELRGVQYVNDSKGTNVDATRRALESFERPILLILGGKDKAGDFRPLQPVIREKVKRVIVMGESARRITDHLAGCAPVSPAESLPQAVELAAGHATSGDVVLLSPACASFDMFRNYDDRGKAFKRLVLALR